MDIHRHVITPKRKIIRVARTATLDDYLTVAEQIEQTPGEGFHITDVELKAGHHKLNSPVALEAHKSLQDKLGIPMRYIPEYGYIILESQDQEYSIGIAPSQRFLGASMILQAVGIIAGAVLLGTGNTDNLLMSIPGGAMAYGAYKLPHYRHEIAVWAVEKSAAQGLPWICRGESIAETREMPRKFEPTERFTKITEYLSTITT
jgi:hypothetical protein